MTDYGIAYVNENRPLSANQKWRVITATDTVELDDFIMVATGAGTYTLTLPECAKCVGKMFLLKNNTSGNVTIVAHGTDAALVTDVTIGTTDTVLIIGGGTFWYISEIAGA